jgi:preprotein translocase subunit SecA
MRRFGGNTISNLMDKLRLEEDIPLEHGLVNKAVETAQQKVEAHNFDLRKHVVEYDDVMNKQRETIYEERRASLGEDTLRGTLMTWLEREIDELVDAYFGVRGGEVDEDAFHTAAARLLPALEAQPVDVETQTRDEIAQTMKQVAEESYEAKEQELGPDVMRQLERAVVLRIIDSHWVRHLTGLDDLRGGIGLRAYGQRDPLVEYKVEAHRMFDELLRAIQHDVAHSIFHVTIAREPQRPRVQAAAMNRGGPSRQPVKAGRKLGRNDPCPCGSGKKYKFCHGR